jgi:hypothetical protein
MNCLSAEQTLRPWERRDEQVISGWRTGMFLPGRAVAADRCAKCRAGVRRGLYRRLYPELRCDSAQNSLFDQGCTAM